jgi:ATPase subunit of ABC transporter with duplicated ATPase domains
VPHAHGALIARSISRSYGDVTVLDGFSLTVAPDSRIGVVGPNGIGKSTLLRILAGVEPPDAGVVRREPADMRIGYLAQEAGTAGRSPGEAARMRIEALIAESPDVLLLDEPTNNLDAAGLAYLEEIVERHGGGMVVVSHDRQFLELMTAIIEFEADTRKTRFYTGGWSAFDAERRLRLERQTQAYGSYAAERDRVEEQARRMRQWQERGYGQGRKKKKGRDLAKAIDMRRRRVEQVEKPWAAWQLQLTLSAGQRGGDIVARLERAVIERDGFTLGPINLEIGNGERLAIVGPNGAGKTTLLKALLGELPLSSGSRWIGPGTVLGTLPQGPGPFSTRAPVIETFTALAEVPIQEARSLLAKFSLGAEDVRRAGDSLSPGERTRAVLATLAARGANTLILDEPTNNLDVESIEQLEAALQNFDGTVVLVTHDRRFLQALGATRQIDLGRSGR